MMSGSKCCIAVVALLTWVPSRALPITGQRIRKDERPREQTIAGHMHFTNTRGEDQLSAAIFEQNGAVHVPSHQHVPLMQTSLPSSGRDSFMRQSQSQKVAEDSPETVNDTEQVRRAHQSQVVDRTKAVNDTEQVRYGWCEPWSLGASIRIQGDGIGIARFPPEDQPHPLTEQECWEKCRADLACEQAVHKKDGDCWLGTDTMSTDPGDAGFTLRAAEFKCFAKRNFRTQPLFASRRVLAWCPNFTERYGLAAQQADCQGGVAAYAMEISCSHWPSSYAMSEKGCFAKCDAHEHCNRAIYRLSKNTLTDSMVSECWIGTKDGNNTAAMPCLPHHNCTDTCYGKDEFPG